MASSVARLVCVAFVAVSLLAGCGESEVGEECDDSGTTDECVDGAICTNEGDGARCRVLCSEQSDCPPGENCNGISGTDSKSCQPGD